MSYLCADKNVSLFPEVVVDVNVVRCVGRTHISQSHRRDVDVCRGRTDSSHKTIYKVNAAWTVNATKIGYFREPYRPVMVGINHAVTIGHQVTPPTIDGLQEKNNAGKPRGNRRERTRSNFCPSIGHNWD